MVRCRSAADAGEQARLQRWQSSLDRSHVLAPAHVNVDVKPPVEVEVDERTRRTAFAQERKDTVQFFGDYCWLSGAGQRLNDVSLQRYHFTNGRIS